MKYVLLLVLFFWIVVISLVAYACSASAASVGQDAYSFPAYWRSYADYIDHKLYVPGLSSPVCTSGVTYLGDHFYEIPAGVENFRCSV